MMFRIGAAVLAAGLVSAAPSVLAGKPSDFNNDGCSDILSRNTSSGDLFLYPMQGTTILSSQGLVRNVSDENWKLAGVGDFNGDGKADVLWRHSTTGQNYVWIMNGKAISSEGFLRTVADPGWQVAAVGDFDGDGKSDILWRNAAAGHNYLWPMDGLTIRAGEGHTRAVEGDNWQVAGVGDFNADTRADVVWRNKSTGENYLWPMNGVDIGAGEGFLRTVADLSWKIAGIGDFNGDNRADILWRNSSTGQNYLHPMNGTAILGTEGFLRTVDDQNWQVQAIGDYDCDGKADILWRHAPTGETYLNMMDGTTVKSEGYPRSQGSGGSGGFTFTATSAVGPSNGTATPSVQRLNGSQGSYTLTYTLVGSGCANPNSMGSVTFVDGEAGSKTINVPMGNRGVCSVSLSEPRALIGQPGSIGITAVPAVAGCPAAPSDVLYAQLSGVGNPIMQRQTSGQMVFLDLPSDQYTTTSGQVMFTESAGGAYTPQPVTLEISISRCPGVIDTDYSNACNLRSTNGNYNAITWLAKKYSILDGSNASQYGYCWAGDSNTKYYVNARWSYNQCAYGASTCGFAVQYNQGPY